MLTRDVNKHTCGRYRWGGQQQQKNTTFFNKSMSKKNILQKYLTIIDQSDHQKLLSVIKVFNTNLRHHGNSSFAGTLSVRRHL